MSNTKRYETFPGDGQTTEDEQSTTMENSFKIFAHGPNFDLRLFEASSFLPGHGLWHKGDVRPSCCFGSRFETSGIEVVLGNGHELTPFEQEDIAIKYIADHRDALKVISERCNPIACVVGIQYNFINDPSVVGFGMGPSPAFMWHCLDIGFSPYYYIAVVSSMGAAKQVDAPELATRVDTASRTPSAPTR